MSYATVGLSEHDLIRDGTPFAARVEIVGACGASYKDFENALATASFCVITSKWFCAPGIIFPGLLDMYDLSNTMSDVYFASPFLWDSLERSTIVDGITIAWLLAIPVSKAETSHANEYGPNALEAIFEREQIDIFDLNRASVV